MKRQVWTQRSKSPFCVGGVQFLAPAHPQDEAQDGEDEAQDGQDEAQGAHRSKSMEGSTAGADPQDGPDEAQDVQDKAPSSIRKFVLKRYGPGLRPIGAPIHVSHGHHPHIPSISEPRRAQVGSKLAPSRAKMAYNDTSKTGISRGRGAKNQGFREQLGHK